MENDTFYILLIEICECHLLNSYNKKIKKKIHKKKFFLIFFKFIFFLMENPNEATQLTFIGCVFGGHYTVTNKIGHGTFGQIFEGINNVNDTKVALKIESIRARFPQLRNEANVYNKLKGLDGFPKLYWFGAQNGYNILIIERLNMTLEEVRVKSGGKIPLKTICVYADKMIEILQNLHKVGIVHRDLKPENFMIGPEEGSLYLLDFGLSKSYCDPATHVHIKYSEKHELTGTARYASINALLGREQSRRDDLEALGYIIIYLYAGALPWQGIKAKSSREKYEQIRLSKQNFAESRLYSELPHEFIDYMTAVRKLAFTETPNYSKLRMFFRDLSRRSGYTSMKDWTPLPQTMSDPLPQIGSFPRKPPPMLGRTSRQEIKVTKPQITPPMSRTKIGSRLGYSTTKLYSPFTPSLYQHPPQ